LVAKCSVERCERPVQNAYVCNGCTENLYRALADLGWIGFQLEIVITRQTRYMGNIGVNSRTARALPFEPRASDVHADLNKTLQSWIRLIVDEARVPPPKNHHVTTMASWLFRHVPLLRNHEAGHSAVTEICFGCQRARACIDRPADYWYAGPCDICDTDMYTKVDGPWIVCSVCNQQYDLQQRRKWLLDAVQDVLATATEISRALTTLSTPVTSERIRQWHTRGRILEHGKDYRAHSLYRVGDVIKLLAHFEAKRQAALR
jgi:hypothetical protein